MGFRGRPSTACHACRGRRIKCDKRKAGCGQCSRGNIPCPGYPDPLEQTYRDESHIVALKAEASYMKKTRRRAMVSNCCSSSSNAITPTDCSLEEMAIVARAEAPAQNLSLHLDTVSITEFMATYVPQSPFDYLPSVCSQQGPSVPVYIQAVALAMTAAKLTDARILLLARRSYATALADTNSALSDPETAVQDSTIISVLLLGLFEAFACRVTGASSDCAMHTRGALALLRLRGQTQFHSELGRRLFGQLCAILTFHSLLHKTPVPPELLELVSVAKRLHWDTPRTSFTTLFGEITKSPCVLWDTDLSASERVVRAQWLDRRVVQYTEDFPLDCQYRELYQKKHDASYSGWETHGCTIHQYQSHHAARLWNACRVLRIMLNAVIHRTLREHPSSTLPTKAESMSVSTRAAELICEAATDICATVPQFLSPKRFDGMNLEASDEARVATLIAALSVVRAEPLVPQTARSYASDRLKVLGKLFKVPLAESAAAGEGLNVLHSGFHMLYVY